MIRRLKGVLIGIGCFILLVFAVEALLICDQYRPQKTEPTMTGTQSSLRTMVMEDPAYFSERSEELGIVREVMPITGPVWFGRTDSMTLFTDSMWGSPDGPGHFELWSFEDSSQIMFFILERTGNPSQMWLPGHPWHQ